MSGFWNKLKVAFLLAAGVVIIIVFSKVLEALYSLVFSWIF